MVSFVLPSPRSRSRPTPVDRAPSAPLEDREARWRSNEEVSNSVATSGNAFRYDVSVAQYVFTRDGKGLLNVVRACEAGSHVGSPAGSVVATVGAIGRGSVSLTWGRAGIRRETRLSHTLFAKLIRVPKAELGADFGKAPPSVGANRTQ